MSNHVVCFAGKNHRYYEPGPNVIDLGAIWQKTIGSSASSYVRDGAATSMTLGILCFPRQEKSWTNAT